MKNLLLKKENLLKKIKGLVSWMISYAQENKISCAIFNSLYEEDYKFPERN